jgi:hypothetical protein
LLGLLQHAPQNFGCDFPKAFGSGASQRSKKLPHTKDAIGDFPRARFHSGNLNVLSVGEVSHWGTAMFTSSREMPVF